MLFIFKDNLVEKHLPQGGSIYKFKNFEEIIQRMFATPEVFSNLHYSYENTTLNEFWTGGRWKTLEAIKSFICPSIFTFFILINSV